MAAVFEGGPKGRPGKNTSSGNRGGEDVYKETRALWKLPFEITIVMPSVQIPEPWENCIFAVLKGSHMETVCIQY